MEKKLLFLFISIFFLITLNSSAENMPIRMAPPTPPSEPGAAIPGIEILAAIGIVYGLKKNIRNIE